jgi:hypothetical protein
VRKLWRRELGLTAPGWPPDTDARLQRHSGWAPGGLPAHTREFGRQGIRQAAHALCAGPVCAGARPRCAPGARAGASRAAAAAAAGPPVKVIHHALRAAWERQASEGGRAARQARAERARPDTRRAADDRGVQAAPCAVLDDRCGDSQCLCAGGIPAVLTPAHPIRPARCRRTHPGQHSRARAPPGRRWRLSRHSWRPSSASTRVRAGQITASPVPQPKALPAGSQRSTARCERTGGLEKHWARLQIDTRSCSPLVQRAIGV